MKIRQDNRHAGVANSVPAKRGDPAGTHGGTAQPARRDAFGQTTARPGTAVHQRDHDDIAQWVQRLRQHIRSTYTESTYALVAAVDAKDPYTRAHSVTVACYAEAISRQLELPARTIKTVRAAALLHDIGKIGVPDAILTKPGPLDEEEFRLIRRHPETAVEILGHVSFLREEKELILHHHERFDGNGYPGGLARERIPLGARILAVADALETMLSARSYKAPYSMEQVRRELIAGAGSQFDPNVVDATLRWFDQLPHDLKGSEPSPSESEVAVGH